MIVARFWAEARAEGRSPDRHPTSVLRFGWSQHSPQEAQRMAEERAAEALARRVRGEFVPHREPTRPYEAAADLPIREEIVEEHSQAVLTRNCYGALCLNTERVMFVDVDEADTELASCVGCLVGGLGGIAAGIGLAFWNGLPPKGAAKRVFRYALIGAVAGAFLLGWLSAAFRRLTGSGEARVRGTMRRLRRWVAAHPEWVVRAYRTPAGLRLLVMHATFDSRSTEAGEFFKAMRSDPRYVSMCVAQHCFRARLTAKPWRIGVDKRLFPRTGRWPLTDPGEIARREDWLREYDQARAGYAACRFLETVGTSFSDPACEQVRYLHDRISGAESGLPIA